VSGLFSGRADQALNRGNARGTVFYKPKDFGAFEEILAGGLERYACRILARPLVTSHGRFRDKVSRLFSGKSRSDTLRRWDDQDGPMKRVGFIMR